MINTEELKRRAASFANVNMSVPVTPGELLALIELCEEGERHQATLNEIRDLVGGVESDKTLREKAAQMLEVLNAIAQASSAADIIYIAKHNVPELLAVVGS